uniref:CRISPR-associated protein, Cas6-related n=1 Tax=uncultured bacterium ws156A7 TaxID=1131828 RepID=I1X4R6_9BACT|nr:CRISPR-associated protein, Cas6-related [uncultured bacterium ws156A7]
MFWQEEQPFATYQIPNDIVDFSFAMNCRALPVDHAFALQAALIDRLPWLAEEEHAGIHQIYGADSGNGWIRPADTDLLQLSQRTRLVLRLPIERMTEAKRLTGSILSVDGFELAVGTVRVRPLSALTTLFARHVACAGSEQSEADFVEQTAIALRALGIAVRKLLCGQNRTISKPDGRVETRSLMLADLEVAHSLLLQQRGLGAHRKLGCGLFVPHKSVDAVVAVDD